MLSATVSTGDLLSATAFAAKLVRRAFIDAIECVSIAADGDGLTISGTDLDTWASARIAGEIKPDEGGLINAALLKQFLSSLPKNTEAALTMADGEATVSAGRARARLAILPLAEFPEPPAVDAEAREVDPETFSAALLWANAAAATEDAKEDLRGICWADGEVVGMNGHRMHLIGLPGNGGRAIIPRAAVPQLADMLKGGGRFALTEGLWRAEADGRVLTGKTLSGPYVGYERIAVASDPIALFDRDALASATRQAALSEEKAHIVKIEGEGEAIVLTAGGSQTIREVRAECPAEIKRPFSTGLTLRYLAEALSIMPDAEIALTYQDEGPVMLEPANGSAFLGRKAIIMPARV